MISVVKNGKHIFAKGYGTRKFGENLPINENTLVQIASHTKPITAAALAMLVDEGKSSSILLDINKNPIRIDDLNVFLSTTRTLYSEAINKYSMGLARLKKSRMISTLTKVHNLEDDVEQ